jgi:hypothetical protein
MCVKYSISANFKEISHNWIGHLQIHVSAFYDVLVLLLRRPSPAVDASFPRRIASAQAFTARVRLCLLSVSRRNDMNDGHVLF